MRSAVARGQSTSQSPAGPGIGGAGCTARYHLRAAAGVPDAAIRALISKSSRCRRRLARRAAGSATPSAVRPAESRRRRSGTTLGRVGTVAAVLGMGPGKCRNTGRHTEMSNS
eukprot:6412952-Prymnesium_polylepis.1